MSISFRLLHQNRVLHTLRAKDVEDAMKMIAVMSAEAFAVGYVVVIDIVSPIVAVSLVVVAIS